MSCLEFRRVFPFSAFGSPSSPLRSRPFGDALARWGQPELSGADDDSGGSGGARSPAGAVRGASGTPPAPQQSPLRPAPSPSAPGGGPAPAAGGGPPGSSARSMSPAIGSQSNIPVPPRPSSSQSESSAPNHLSQPQLPQQGYNQQMQASSMYGAKMHPGIMSSSYPGPHYPQSSYPRQQQQQGGLGAMPGYGPPQGGGYPAAGRMAAAQGGGYPYGNASSSQYGGYGGANSLMPPPPGPQQYPKGAGAGGGGAGGGGAASLGAAMPPGGQQGPPPARPMYLRQHLQQKMYGYSSPMTPPEGASPSDAPPPPPGACYSQCPPTPMGGPSAVLLSQQQQQQGVGGSPPVVGPGQEGGGGRPPPPAVLDEGSQASNASASSSLPEEHLGPDKGGGGSKQPPMSHPPTPNTLPSPGGASMSSFHDEFESVSSPSWPRTPASPVVNSQVYEHHMIKRPDGLLKLYDMSEDPERRAFLDKLIVYNDERGTPITQCPTISKQPLDLFRLYLIVKDRGGFVEVTKAKHWKDVAGVLGIGASSSAAYTLRKQYIKHLLPFECKFDRGGIDPQPIISQLESASRKKAKGGTMSPSGASQDYGPPAQSMEGYPSSGGYHHPGAPYPAGGPPSMMGASEYPCPPGYPPSNHVGAEPDGYPPTDEGPYPGEGYPPHGYSHQAPPYAAATQSSLSGGSCGYAGPGGEQYGPAEGYHHEGGYNGRGADPYGYPMRPQSGAGPYPPQYQGTHYDRERYEQQQAQQQQQQGASVGGAPSSQPGAAAAPSRPQPPPSSQMGAGPPPSAAEPLYPYGSSPAATGGAPPPSQSAAAAAGSYQSRPYPPPTAGSQAPPYASAPPPPGAATAPPPQGATPEPYPGPAARGPPDQAYQVYPGSGQQVGYPGGGATPPQGGQPPPPAAAAGKPGPYPPQPTQREAPYPKRHPDFMKPQEPYPPPPHMAAAAGGSPYPPPQPPQPQQAPPLPATQQQYPDRSQYPYRPPHMMTPPPSSMAPQQGWGRGGAESQYRGYPNTAYPPHSGAPPERWEGPRIGDGAPPAWGSSRGVPPAQQGEPYPPPLLPQQVNALAHHKLAAAYARDRGPYPPPPAATAGGKMPQQQQPSGGPYGGSSSSLRKEVVFPPDSVEAVLPVGTKRRRLYAKDVSPLEAWRLMMCLKSGLLAESTWALDVLSVLLYDDSTVLYFGLSHLPGLLETLMEHFRRCLALVFDTPDDLEMGYEEESSSSRVEEERPWYLLDRDCPARDPLEGLVVPTQIDPSDRIAVLPGPGFTWRTRCGKAVRARPDDEGSLHVLDGEKRWDVHEGFTASPEHWQLGGGEITAHIETCFEVEANNVRFVRLMAPSSSAEKTELKKEPEEEMEEEEAEEEEEEEAQPLAAEKVATSRRERCASSSQLSEVLAKQKAANCKREPVVLIEDIRSKIKLEAVRVDHIKQEVKEERQSNDRRRQEEEEPSSRREEESSSADTVVTTTQEAAAARPDERDRADGEMDKDGASEEGAAGGDGEGEGGECRTEEKVFPRVREEGSRKRPPSEALEEEAYCRDEPSLCVVSEAREALGRRCVCISTLLRNLSFVPGNDAEMSKHSGLLVLLGRLLLLRHWHAPRRGAPRHYDQEESASAEAHCSSLLAEREWWWEGLQALRENTLVCLANMAGQLSLAPFPEEISRPLLDGLLHWATCGSACARDPLPQSALSPQRLALEALCKLSVQEANVDLLLATPPWGRTRALLGQLARWLGRGQDQVLRELALVLLSNVAPAGSGAARAVALQGPCLAHLLAFVEQAEQSALQVANAQGVAALRDNPELMGTTLDMVRRAAATLRCLARVPDNRPLFLQLQPRLLALVMSQILDQGVAAILADVLFECSQQPQPQPS